MERFVNLKPITAKEDVGCAIIIYFKYKTIIELPFAMLIALTVINNAGFMTAPHIAAIAPSQLL